ncbi:hypothetical protein BO224_02010, partial [Erysipelotrichaceae bacterium NYU-BL-E8]
HCQKLSLIKKQSVLESTSFNLQSTILVQVFDSSSEKLPVQGLSDGRYNSVGLCNSSDPRIETAPLLANH